MSAKSCVTTADENYLEAVLMIQNRAGAVRSVGLCEVLVLCGILGAEMASGRVKYSDTWKEQKL